MASDTQQTDVSFSNIISYQYVFFCQHEDFNSRFLANVLASKFNSMCVVFTLNRSSVFVVNDMSTASVGAGSAS